MRMQLEPVEGIAEGGRLWLSGPNVMLGYMTADRPGELQPLADGWHDSGDIVSVDREGFISIRGRAKRFAKIAGEMVSLGAVEMLVQSLWPEEHHAVVSVPDKRRGERIVLVTTAGDAEPNALRQYRQAGGRRRTDGAAATSSRSRRCRCSAPARPTTPRRGAWRSSGSGSTRRPEHSRAYVGRGARRCFRLFQLGRAAHRRGR